MNAVTPISGPDPVRELIEKTRVRMMFDYAFFGTMATGLELVESPWCKTLATDGKRLYYNREFVKGLTYPQLKFGLCHEVLHCVLDHLGRRRGRNKKIWNIAIDYITNATLLHEKCGEMPDGIYCDPAKYPHTMSAEEVYDDLIKNSTTIKIKNPFDEHLDLPGDEDEGEGDGQGDGEGDGGDIEVTVLGKDGPPKISREDMEEIRNQIIGDTIRAMQAAASRGGKVPEGIRRKIADLVEPKMNWKSMLRAHNRSALKGNFTFKKISRRTYSLGGRFILPAQDVIDELDLAAAIDASGSVTDEMIREFLSECYGIMRTFVAFRFRLWTFDTQCYGYQEFTQANVSDIKRYAVERVHGGGGTSFPENWRFMRERKLKPKRFVLFTDGEPNSEGWGEPDYCPTLFVIHSKAPHFKAPFGRSVIYERSTPAKERRANLITDLAVAARPFGIVAREPELV